MKRKGHKKINLKKEKKEKGRTRKNRKIKEK